MDRRKISGKLNIAKQQVAFQNEEKEKRSAELIIANQELVFQNLEKENRATELLIANEELVFQNKEKENRAAELIIANNELAFQNEEKEKRSAELVIANRELKKSESDLNAYLRGLAKMLFLTSHRVRHPIANILGIANQLHDSLNSPIELKILVEHIKQNAIALDTLTEELTTFMSDLQEKGKNKSLASGSSRKSTVI